MAGRNEFELIKIQEIPELKTRASLYRHVPTNAEVLSLESDDANKVFGITFRTPPRDSTGVAHILEHAVLCGSRKFQVKEPFVELMKGSLNTFLNAFTYPDRTCYPVASQNLKDFYNLIDVYLDAVFFPRITRHAFQQEGWHYELENTDDPLIYKGVVYNEMKGAYSSPDRILMEQVQRSLFPDNTYGFESGGHPREIPKLTYEQFKLFHETYYHPSNARIFFYGDDEPEQRLNILHDYLKHFTRREIASAIPLQHEVRGPLRVREQYAIGEDELPDKKTMVAVNFLLPEITDIEENFALSVLAHVLLATPASPLHKALIDSGLGEDVTGVGLENELRQMYFSVGLKGIATADADKVEQLILGTLERLTQEGIDRDTITASLNTIEFGLREQNTGSYPRGLVLMLSGLTYWLYDRDPLVPLRFERPFQSLKDRIAKDSRYFEKRIQQYLLANTNRSTVVLEPETTLAQQEEERERSELQQAREAMSSDELQEVITATQTLKRLQQTPDSPEALAAIPRLALSDLDKLNKQIPLAILDRGGNRILYHDLFTNGIAYFDLGFDLHSLPQELLPFLPLFSRALKEMGTTEQSFVQLMQRIGQETGGIRTSIFTSTAANGNASCAWLLLRGKAMVDKVGEMLAIMRDMITKVDFSNQERFRQMVLDEKASEEAALVPSGHSFVATRLRARFNENGWLDELLGGISYYFFVHKLIDEVNSNWPKVQQALEEIRTHLFSRLGMITNVTLDEENWDKVSGRFEDFLQSLPATPTATAQWQPTYLDGFEGLTIPSQINFVGKGANLLEAGYKFHGSALVISNYLRTSWLWERVRMEGGAYGAYCSFDRHSGIWSYVSYRDPNLLKTIENYDRAAEFLSQNPLTEDELTKSIIGTIGDIDVYRLPDAKGYASLVRYLIGDSDETRQCIRDEVLATRPEHFKAFAEILKQLNERAKIVVMGSPAAIEKANEAKNGWLQVTKVK